MIYKRPILISYSRGHSRFSRLLILRVLGLTLRAQQGNDANGHGILPRVHDSEAQDGIHDGVENETARETAPSDVNFVGVQTRGETDSDDVLMDHEWRGFLRTVWLVIAVFVAWLACTVLAMLFCTLCVVGTGLLWCRGLWSVRQWVRWRQSRDGAKFDECPVIMPGEGRRNRWIHAWEIAKSKNLRTWEDPDSPHFNVAPLLKSSTGLNLTVLLDKLHKEMEESEKDERMDDLDLPGSWGSNGGVGCACDKVQYNVRHLKGSRVQLSRAP